ncbi:type II toxin-antitoxin system RelE/ParE family toxin [Pseudomonas sp.]|jgi:proteic killer suppression protein|uniref:type II toxin-antitoxin system RelE/ParE family toxin n=1 Tax=Pseudomonas sp. TaxID=306 RepID=UPI002ED8CB2C
MIRTFKHKGLRAFFETGSTKGIRPDHAKRLSQLLGVMAFARNANDLDIPGFRLHPLRGDLIGFWSVSVSGNWRIIFRFIDNDIELVNYLDYH